MKNKVQQLSLYSPYIKFLSALLAAFTIPLFSGVLRYLPWDEDRATEFYSNFGYEFTIALIINLTLLFIVILPLSIFIDGWVEMKVKIKQTLKSLINVMTYILIGILCGVIYSLFIQSHNPIKSILYGVILASIFFIYQSIFFWMKSKIKK